MENLAIQGINCFKSTNEQQCRSPAHARHVIDHDHIVLMDGCLLIERIETEQVQRIQLDPYWTRITQPSRAEDLIKLEAKGIKIEVGRFVTKSKRRRIAKELRNELRGGLFMPAKV